MTDIDFESLSNDELHEMAENGAETFSDACRLAKTLSNRLAGIDSGNITEEVPEHPRVRFRKMSDRELAAMAREWIETGTWDDHLFTEVIDRFEKLAKPRLPTEHVVAHGETLSSIAVKYYWDAQERFRIHHHNAFIKDPDKIFVGLMLHIPDK